MTKGMKKNYIKGILPCSLVALITLVGCINQEQVLMDAAAPIAENMFKSMNEGDYAGFTKDFSREMKEAITVQRFIDLKERYESVFGKYISSFPIKVVEKGEYDAVYFYVEFEREENVPVEISFKKDDELHEVYGLWFVSEMPDNDSKPEGSLEDFVTGLEKNPIVRLAAIIASFVTILVVIIGVMKHYTRKEEKKRL